MSLFWIAFACLCAAAALLLSAYRRLRGLDARCEAAAAAVESALERRHSMLPALVGLMQAFAPREREAIDIVVRAHGAAQRAATPQAKLLAETWLADGVHYLRARARATPQIAKLADFQQLEIALDEAELRLAAERRNLSAATQAYNLALDGFPASLFALRMRFAPRAFYDIAIDASTLGEEIAV
jgi:LemA protein